jgi:hypothetical protein
MAVVAGKLFVRTVQQELRPQIVIEVPELPVACGVATLALLAKPPLMHIVFLVATDTV